MYSLLFVGSTVVAYMDKLFQSHLTIRHSKCELLLSRGLPCQRCSFCESHRKVPHVLLGRHKNTTPQLKTAYNSHVNYRYRTTPEKKQRLRELHTCHIQTKVRLAQLTTQLQAFIADEGMLVNEAIHNNLKQIFIAKSLQVCLLTNFRRFVGSSNKRQQHYTVLAP